MYLGSQFMHNWTGFNHGILQYSLIGVVGMICGVLLLTSKTNYKVSVIDIALLFQLLFTYLSLQWSTEVSNAYAGLYFQITILLTFFIIKILLLYKPELTKFNIHHIVLVLTSLFSVYFFIHNLEQIQALISSSRSYQVEIKTTKSFIGNKNQTGWYLGLCVYVLFATLESSKFKKLSLSIIALAFVHLLLMGSRNAYVSFAIFTLTYIIFTKPNLKFLIKVASSILILTTLFIVTIGADKFINQIKHNSLNSRFRIWDKAMELFYDHPIKGIGVGQFSSYRDSVKLDTTIQPHNDFISYLIEIGTIGLSIHLIILSLIIYTCLKTIRRPNVNKAQRKQGIILLSSILAIISLSIFDELRFKLNHQILIMVIWALVDYRNSKTESKNMIRYIFSGAVFCLSVLLSLYGYTFNKNHELAKRANQVPIQNISEKISLYKDINQNIFAEYKRMPIHEVIGNLYYSISDFENAKYHYEYSVKRKISDNEIKEKYIECCYKLDYYLDALPYIFKMLDEDPCSIKYNNLMNIAAPFASDRQIIDNYRKTFNEKCF